MRNPERPRALNKAVDVVNDKVNSCNGISHDIMIRKRKFKPPYAAPANFPTVDETFVDGNSVTAVESFSARAKNEIISSERGKISHMASNGASMDAGNTNPVNCPDKLIKESESTSKRFLQDQNCGSLSAAACKESTKENWCQGRFESKGNAATPDVWNRLCVKKAMLPVKGLRSTVCSKLVQNSKFKPPVQVTGAHSILISAAVENSSQHAACSSVRSPEFIDTARVIGSCNPQQDEIQANYYSVMYCIIKKNSKRKGPWCDGVFICRGRSRILQDEEGKVITKENGPALQNMPEGASVSIGKFEVEVMREIPEKQFLSGKVFLTTIGPECSPVVRKNTKRTFSGLSRSGTTICRYRGALPGTSSMTAPQDALVLHDAHLGGARVAVVVDPYVASKLRPHQREGVKFMYNCIMGLQAPCFTGCLLADAMGLGKTLQVIALIWTLIKQGPEGCPVVKRVLVICPSTLVQNWKNEVRKWLGSERLDPLVVHAGMPAKDAKQEFLNFKTGQVCPLLITSYELVRKHHDILRSAKPELLVCDEAHRLKNCAGNKTINSLLALDCSRKVLLTGTPIQNDLNEFYAMMDFANPNLLGTLSTFKRLFAHPIERSRDRNASKEEQELGRARSLELQTRTRFCIQQRAASVNSKYLPSKTEYVVFCKLQPPQVSLYQAFLRSKLVRDFLHSAHLSASVLSAIGTLRKLCNHPKLVHHDLLESIASYPQVENVSSIQKAPTNQLSNLSSRHVHDGEEWVLSGKLTCLNRLISAVCDCPKPGLTERIVVVSNFTKTLDIIQAMCDSHRWTWLRLDGATEVSARQSLVDQFNLGHTGKSIFLLSSKAGGSGLNLIGANRLVLFDPDWNPATDAQAMARVWRDGQKKAVIIYRLLTTGSIEEKIYQRQIVKEEVAATVEVMECTRVGNTNGQHFSREEIHELFSLNMDTSCDTFDLLQRSNVLPAKTWEDCSANVQDPALVEAIKSGVVSFVRSLADTKIEKLVGLSEETVELLEILDVYANQPIATVDLEVQGGDNDEHELMSEKPPGEDEVKMKTESDGLEQCEMPVKNVCLGMVETSSFHHPHINNCVYESTTNIVRNNIFNVKSGSLSSAMMNSFSPIGWDTDELEALETPL